jgi:hypothetical protein
VERLSLTATIFWPSTIVDLLIAVVKEPDQVITVASLGRHPQHVPLLNA